jgi:dihydrofolate synthase/folylpolyglutamate synthase
VAIVLLVYLYIFLAIILLMNQIKDFQQANRVLRGYIGSSDKLKAGGYSLESMKSLMRFLGNPQNKLKVIHVAGTSGKSSTCYYISSLLANAGFNVGLTVSPHVDEINERLQINQEPLPEAEYCRHLSEFINVIQKSNLKPSYFELLVAFAYWYFTSQDLDYVVIEVGLGGLVDGTNVVDRADKVCVITDIGLDHTKVLGNTVREIASQKAGIIMENNQVFMNEQPNEVMDVIRNHCKERGAELRVIGGNEEGAGYSSELNHMQGFLRRNLSLAVQVVNAVLLRDNFQPLSPGVVKRSSKTIVPARMEVVSFEGKTVILDGSHNSQKLEALVQAMNHKFPDKEIVCLLSFGQAKADSLLAGLRQIRKLSDRVVLTEYLAVQDEIRKPLDITELEEYCKQAGFNNIHKQKVPEKAFQELIGRPADVHLVTGSFYLMNHIRPIIFK